MAGRIAVIGGANMDIGGFSQKPLVMEDSNIGCVRMSAGGVGRNIAENAARMGLDVQFISAVGDDANGRALLSDLHRKGIGSEYCLTERKLPTSVYLFIADANGDMRCAINDMSIQQALTPERLAPRMAALNAMDAVCIDANLPEETIGYLAENLCVPLFADAVSAAKAGKLKNALHRLYGLKPNRIEAELLTGMRIRSPKDALKAAERLLQFGVKRVFLTMGTQGAVYAGDGECAFAGCGEIPMVNATGAGDAFTAALLWAHEKKLSVRESCLAGMAAAAIAVESAETVNPEMSEEKLIAGMRRFSDIMPVRSGRQEG